MAEATKKKTKRVASKKTGDVAVKDRKPTRSAGRPARLSRSAILQKSIELLEQDPASHETFSLARVAAALDTVTMALYKYFPSREALLIAVGDHICMQFKMPKPKRDQRWQDTLLQWLWAFKDHADRHPIIFKVMGVDGQFSAGWMRVTMTVARTLAEQGLSDRELAMHVWLFCANAISLVFYEREGSAFREPFSFSHLDQLEPDEQEMMLVMRKFQTKIKSHDVLELGFEQLIANVERKLEMVKAAS